MIKIIKLRLRNFDNKTPEEGRRTYWPKRCGNNNKCEDNSPKTLNDKNRQASSQKFRQLLYRGKEEIHGEIELTI